MMRWRTFCEELESFVEHCGMQEAHPNESCAHAIIERMESVLGTLRIIHENLLELDLSEEDSGGVQEYVDAIQDCMPEGFILVARLC